MHNWFPWSHCLRNLMIRTYSLSTYDSVIYRRTTMLNRQTSFNNNSCSSKSIKATTTLNGSARPMRKLHRVGTEVRTNKSNIPVRKFSSIQYKHRLPSSDEQPWHLIFSVNLFFIIISKNDNVNIEERCFKKKPRKIGDFFNCFVKLQWATLNNESFMILIYIKNQSDGAELYAMIEHW